MAVIATLDFAAAVNLTGDATVLPGPGEHTVTPVLPAEQAVGFGAGVGLGEGEGLGEAVNASVMSAAVAAAPG